MAENDDKKIWVPAQGAAQLMGTTELNVLMHIKRGFLKGREEEGAWYVSSESLAAFREKGGGAKAQVVCKTGCAAKKGGCGSCG
jgi:hypothetical protein